MQKQMILGILFALLASPLVFALAPSEDATNATTVAVNVTSNIMVEIAPTTIQWDNVAPGAESTTFRDTEKGTTGHSAIVVRNIGSVGIKTIWFNSTAPSSNPFGTGVPGNYDTANFVLLSKADADGNSSSDMTSGNYYYISKKEFAEGVRDGNGYTVSGTNVPYVLTTNTANRNTSVGRIRDGANEYFWALTWAEDASVQGTGQGCNASIAGSNQPSLYLGLDAHNTTSLGDVDLRNSCDDDDDSWETADTCESLKSGNTDASDEFDVDGAIFVGYLDTDSTRFEGAVVRVAMDCQSLDLITWNKDTAADTIDTKLGNYWASNSTDATNFPQGYDLGNHVLDSLNPGQSLIGYLKLRLPFGVPTGTLGSGSITVLVSDENPPTA